MSAYVTNIENDTLENTDYRRVFFTGPNTQLVLMMLRPGEEIASRSTKATTSSSASSRAPVSPARRETARSQRRGRTGDSVRHGAQRHQHVKDHAVAAVHPLQPA